MFRATKIISYLKVMQSRGISREEMLRGTCIDSAQLESDATLISVEQYYAVVANMLRLNEGVEGVGLTLGNLVDLSDFGILGYAMVSARNLRDLLDIWMQCNNSLVGTPFRVTEFNELDNGFQAVYPLPVHKGDIYRFEVEELLAQTPKIIKDITGEDPVFSSATFAYSEPPYRHLYEQYLQCDLLFDAPQTTLTALAPVLDAPVKTANDELYRICVRHCHHVMQSINATDDLWDRLRSLFLANPGKLPNMRTASIEMGLSPRTLARHLAETGHSYQAMKDTFRYDLAREYLQSGHFTAKKAAYVLGFTSPSAFSRAFKGWAGQTVGQFMDADKT